MADAKFHHQNKPDTIKFYSRFLYKALVVTIFLVLLPIFPSQAPEFITQTLNTRGWEFLHLIFVGIAVSYGLFSRRNDESEKDNSPSKLDNAQSYVSRFLQVSSVFDDEVDGPGLSRCDGVSTVQTWNNQYYRNEPVVVVADQNLDQQQKSSNSRVGEKPLLLPVRSLKSRVFDADAREESFGVSNSNLGSKRFSSNLEENLKNNVVLPSPIPWRSRSGRIEFKETKQEQPNSPPLYSQPSSSIEESEFNRSLKCQTSRVSRSESTTSSPKLSSSPNKFSTETRGKSAEDFVRKKTIYRSPPPPPPPPPPPTTPPQLIRKSKASKPIDDEVFTPMRSFTSEPKSVRTSRSHEFDQSSVKTEKVNRERVSFMPQATVMEFPKEEKEETVEKLVLESEEDLETEDEEDDEIERDCVVPVPSSGGGSCSSDGGPDVDKKADEFIAKFREQIRLQRIESIRRSSGQINRKNRR
ncbi:uncharacterized protein [Euphorbia lathyris]|uniref:uncharacterized protein n=1 Tax=Euphorbia lathyris TaxID=212925 RepID=UPI003313CA00